MYDDLPTVEVVVVPIGGGGLISGVLMALRSLNPVIRIIGVDSSGAPAMKRSVEEGHRVELDHADCGIDGLTVKRVAAAEPVAAALSGLIDAEPGSAVVCVLSGATSNSISSAACAGTEPGQFLRLWRSDEGKF